MRTSGTKPSPTPISIRLLALGDSYTVGEQVGTEESWPVLLAGDLRGRGLPITEPQIAARPGRTAGGLAAALDAAPPSGPFDLVTLLIGANDHYRGGRVEEYRRQFRLLLERAVRFAGGAPGRVIVLSIPDWGATPFAAGRDRTQITAGIDTFNDANRDETTRAGAGYGDVTPISRTVGREGTKALLAADGLHPSGRMHAEWARLALPQALAAIARASSGRPQRSARPRAGRPPKS